MDFNKLMDKKKENWVVWVTLNDDNESTEIVYIKYPEKMPSSPIERDEIIVKELHKLYSKSNWLAYNVE